MVRFRNFAGTVIPSASRWELYICGHCPNVHLVLFTDDGKPFAEAVFSLGALNHFHDKGRQAINDAVRDNIYKQNKRES